MRIVAAIVALFIALTSFACGGDSVPTTPTQAVRLLTVSGATALTGPQTSQFIAVAILSNGSAEDQTRTATWASSNNAVVSVSPAGLVSSVGSGTAQVRATYQGVTGTMTVNAIVAATTPALTATFSSIQREIFEGADSTGRRPCVSCHTNTGRNPSAGLNLNRDVAYAQLVNVPSNARPGAIRIVAGDADKSDLIPKLEGQPGIAGGRMPPSAPFLTGDQVLIIRRWIQLGARND